MAAFLYKWLLISLFPINSYLPGEHPFHVSTTEVNHNAAEKTLEISCRIFTDDFESALTQAFHTKADFSNASLKTAMDTLVKKYMNVHLLIKAEGRPVTLTYLGFEIEKEAAYIYIQADNIAGLKKMEATNSILHDLYKDQINIMHVVVGGNRKSTKLDYPARDAVFTY